MYLVADARIQEDEIIMQQFNELGPRWADISKVFNGKRTDNAVSDLVHRSGMGLMYSWLTGLPTIRRTGQSRESETGSQKEGKGSERTEEAQAYWS